MDWKKIGHDLIVAAVDKIFLAVIAAIIVYYIEDSFRRMEHERQHIVTVAQLFTSQYEQSIQDINNILFDYIENLENIRDNGQVGSDSRVRDLGIAHRQLLWRLGFIRLFRNESSNESEFDESSRELLNAIAQTNMQIRNELLRGDQIDSNVHQIHMIYVSLLSHMRNDLVDVLRQERSNLLR